MQEEEPEQSDKDFGDLLDICGEVLVTSISGQEFKFMVSFSDPSLVIMAYIQQDFGIPIRTQRCRKS